MATQRVSCTTLPQPLLWLWHHLGHWKGNNEGRHCRYTTQHPKRTLHAIGINLPVLAAMHIQQADGAMSMWGGTCASERYKGDPFGRREEAETRVLCLEYTGVGELVHAHMLVCKWYSRSDVVRDPAPIPLSCATCTPATAMLVASLKSDLQRWRVKLRGKELPAHNTTPDSDSEP